MNTHALGVQGEDMACRWIVMHGGVVLERNFRFRGGEIDIIAKDDDYICFVEVKYRTGMDYGDAADAVDIRKQKKLSRGCDFYLLKHSLGEFTPVRFDVITLDPDMDRKMAKVKWYKNAFDYIPTWGRML